MKGHVFEKDGMKKVVVITGGTDDEPLYEALDMEGENCSFPTFNGRTADQLRSDLADWIDCGLLEAGK